MTDITQRRRRHQRTAADQYRAGRHKPPTRRQVKAWLAPVRAAFRQLLTGETDAIRGYAVTRLRVGDIDYARIDHCINAFTAMLNRLGNEFDTQPLDTVSLKLDAGIMLTRGEIEACMRTLAACENSLIKFNRADLIDAAMTEQVNIELERLGLKKAA